MSEAAQARTGRAPRQKFQVPDGWVARGFTFEVEWPAAAAAAARIRSHFGARRFAYNWALAQVKSDLAARKKDPSHDSVQWSMYALRKRWNAEKAEIAPWWGENSKEAYATGIADLVTALKNWDESRNGIRKGRKVGFPRFRSRRADRARVRFTTGAMRVEGDRRTITLPVVGSLRSKESTRRLQRLIATGKARILNATLIERWGRLLVSFGCIVCQRRPAPARPDARCGVDLGLRRLATVADSDGAMVEIPNPTPLRATLAARRRAGRQMSRRIYGSRGYSAAKAKCAALDRRCVHLRRQASHQLTSWLAGTYGEVVIEDLDIAAMKQSMGRRAFRRSVSDAALGQIRPQLAYKTAWTGGKLTVADRWFASSQIHHGCGCRLAGGRFDEWKICAVTGERVHRDRNAALNLRDWPETHASLGSVGAQAPPGEPGGQACGTSHERGRPRKTSPPGLAAAGEARTCPEPREGVPTA